VSHNSPIIHVIGTILVHDLDAVAIEIYDGRIEVTILVASAGRCAVRPTASGQSSGIEVSNSSPTLSGEGDVRCASFHAARSKLV
jgi:hypothetical protein